MVNKTKWRQTELILRLEVRLDFPAGCHASPLWGFPIKARAGMLPSPGPNCHLVRTAILCLPLLEQPRCFPQQATRFLASFAAMVSNVNSRGVPGRETAGGYLIHHNHARQATLHTAL